MGDIETFSKRFKSIARCTSRKRNLRLKITRSLQNLENEFVLRLRQIGVHNVWMYLHKDDILMYRKLYSRFKRIFRRTTMTDVDIFEDIDQIDARFQRYEFEQTNAGYQDVAYTGNSLYNAFVKFARRSGLDDEILVKNEYKPLNLSRGTVGKNHESYILRSNAKMKATFESKSASNRNDEKSSTIMDDTIQTHVKHLSELWDREQDIQCHLYRQSYGELSWLRCCAKRKGKRKKKIQNDEPSSLWMEAAEYAEIVPGNSPPVSNTTNIWPGQRLEPLDLDRERRKQESASQFEKRMCGSHHSGGHERRERPMEVNF